MTEDLELRAWLAEHLGGYRFDGNSVWKGDELIHTGLGKAPSLLWLIEHRVVSGIPAYEASWEGMGLVVEAMRERGWWYNSFCHCADVTAATTFIFYHEVTPRSAKHDGRASGTAPTAPLAAARAARAAIEAEKNDGN